MTGKLYVRKCSATSWDWEISLSRTEFLTTDKSWKTRVGARRYAIRFAHSLGLTITEEGKENGRG